MQYDTIVLYNPNTCKFQQLLNSCSHVILEKLCRFIKIINVKVAPPGKLTITQLITQTYCNIYTDVYNAFYNYAVR